jgi:hypothetical protein
LPLLEFLDVTRNDSDPDRDSLEVVEVTEPQVGMSDLFSHHTVVYQLDEARASDSFGYTISDNEFESSATVEIYIDCACTVLCLSGLELPEQRSGQAVGAIDLPLIYQVRDQVLKPTLDGRRYVEMYYHSNPEILVNIVTNEALRDQALATIELWQAPLRNLTSGDGSALLTQEQIDALEDFLGNLSAVSSAELQEIIAAELQRVGPLDAYVGMRVKEAKKEVIGDATLYVPLIASHE